MLLSFQPHDQPCTVRAVAIVIQHIIKDIPSFCASVPDRLFPQKIRLDCICFIVSDLEFAMRTRSARIVNIPVVHAAMHGLIDTGFIAAGIRKCCQAAPVAVEYRVKRV